MTPEQRERAMDRLEEIAVATYELELDFWYAEHDGDRHSVERARQAIAALEQERFLLLQKFPEIRFARAGS